MTRDNQVAEPVHRNSSEHHPDPRFAVILIIGAGILATVVSWYGTERGDEPTAPTTETSDTGSASGENSSAVTRTAVTSTPPAPISVESIELPHFEPLMPPGPGRDLFMTNCITCHSPRLVTDQPHFPRETWEGIVGKMVNTFGGHIAEDDQPRIVDYLVSIRGQAGKP